MNRPCLTSQIGKPLIILTLLILTSILLSFRLSGEQKPASGQPISGEARKIHLSAIVIDTHSDTSSETVNGFDIATKDSKQMEDVGKLRAGGMGAQFFAAYVGEKYVKTSQSAHRALEMIDTIRFDIVARHPEAFALATTADDIERIHKQGKIAALIGIEGGHAIEDSLRLLRDFYAVGVRYMTLTHVNTNNWADSSGDIDKPDVTHHNGLTDFGREVIHEMNRLGMMVDISHVSDKTFYDVLGATRAPVIASHSSCRALTNIPRNMTDDMIKALARNGGVIQINFGCEFLSQRSADEGVKRWQAMDAIQEKYKNDPEKLKEEQKRLMEDYRKNVPPATLDDVVAHIDHVKKLVGIDYVGLGSDFDGVTCTPVGLEDASKVPNLTQALLDKGYSADEIRKVLGGNTLRLMRAGEKAAGK
ncbi:MAG: membrane dipeptidase [Acidobacteriia bacterium]|nr:membrane dipeptidase [Terriglobia bacterium]